MCSRAILMTHRGNHHDAAVILDDAAPLLVSLRGLVMQETVQSLVLPEQEYVEARSLLQVATGGALPTCDELGVMPQSYVLGLLDTVGELKRLMLDRIRDGNMQSALDVFDVMEQLYRKLYPFSMYDKVLKESRRKLDVCRIVMEDARMAITEEKRRQRLLDAMESAGGGI